MKKYKIKDRKCVCIMHWGFEYNLYPMPSDINLAHWLIDSGWDMVIGHHPHNTQPYEEYHGKLIYYSLGNFYFASRRDKFNCLFNSSVPNRCDYGAGVILSQNQIKNTIVYFDKEKNKSYILNKYSSCLLEKMALIKIDKKYLKIVRKTKKNINPVLTGNKFSDFYKLHILFIYYKLKSIAKEILCRGK